MMGVSILDFRFPTPRHDNSTLGPVVVSSGLIDGWPPMAAALPLSKIANPKSQIEDLTLAHGREIFARLDHSGPLPFTLSWWDERIMEWTMADETRKVHLFRFIDVLPLLHSPPQITRHLREYFAEAGTHLPGWMRVGVRWLPGNGLLGSLVAHSAYRS